MNVRSRGLAAAGLILLASAAGLGAVLAREGDAVNAADLASAQPGERVEIKGTPEEFFPQGSLGEWRDILPLFGNFTYALEADDVVVILTGNLAAPDGLAVADGVVAWSGDHPDSSGRVLVVVQVAHWREPLLR